MEAVFPGLTGFPVCFYHYLLVKSVSLFDLFYVTMSGIAHSSHPSC
jgi:hypothetical protein